MRLVVVGTGAIGGSVGGRLAATGHDVVAIARAEHAAAIRTNGLVVVAREGAIAARIPVVERVSHVDWQAQDVILLAVKTQDVAAAIVELPRQLPIVCLTSGLEAERICARWFGEVHAASIHAPCEVVEPGVIRQWASPIRGTLELGRYPRGATDLDHRLAISLASSGFACEVREDILPWKRTKLLRNLSNALEALCGPAARQSELASRAVAEGVAVMQAAGWTLVPAAEEAKRRKLVIEQPVEGITRPGGSTWQSLARGRTLETDYLNGEIVLLGRRHGVPTPVNELLQRAADEAARTRRAPGTVRLADLIP